jgi:hypothetical protein
MNSDFCKIFEATDNLQHYRRTKLHGEEFKFYRSCIGKYSLSETIASVLFATAQIRFRSLHE